MPKNNSGKIRVLLMGYPYFVKRLMELAEDSDMVFDTLPKTIWQRWLTLFRSDLIYLIGGDLRPNRFYWVAIFLGKKIVMHWVGSDILEMQEWKKQGHHFSAGSLTKAAHWAEVGWTASELEGLGVSPQIVPLTPASFPEEIRNLPEKFVVLTYLPPGKALFYGEEQIVQLAQNYPEITFLIVASAPNDRPDNWPSNMISVGWVNDMAELYREITVLIRLTEHDGLSFMVLEALAHARHVIWSYHFDGVRQATNYTSLKRIMDELVQNQLQDKLHLNITGREYVERNYNPHTVWEQISQGLIEVLKK